MQSTNMIRLGKRCFSVRMRIVKPISSSSTCYRTHHLNPLIMGYHTGFNSITSTSKPTNDIGRKPNSLKTIRTQVTVTKTSAIDDNNNEDVSSSSSSQSSIPNPVIFNSKDDHETNITHSQPINITPACIKRIHQLAKGKNLDPSSLYLRIYVDPGGCSGFQYQFEIETHESEPLDEDDDIQFHVGESSVVVDKESLEMIKGSTIDYVTEMIRSGFKIVDNPLSESACGCGSSFAIKNFEANQ